MGFFCFFSRMWSTSQILINPLSASVSLVQKLVNWFAQQINSLASIWGQHWHLMGYFVIENEGLLRILRIQLLAYWFAAELF